MDLLEQKCSKMILDCVDWGKLEIVEGDRFGEYGKFYENSLSQKHVSDVAHLYDILYQIYCAKLTVDGQEYA